MFFRFIRGILHDRKNGSKILNKYIAEIIDCISGIIKCMKKRQKCNGCYYFDTKKDYCMFGSDNPRWEEGKGTLCKKQ